MEPALLVTPAKAPKKRTRLALSLGEARRIALAAQGFGQPKPAKATKRHLLSTIQRLGLVQIDSVNVLVRAHYFPAFSRIGPYPTEWLDELAYRKRQLFEYWGHAASLIPVNLFPSFRWRMERAKQGHGVYRGLVNFAKENAALIQEVLEQIRQHGPAGAGDVEKAIREEQLAKKAGWWEWSDSKIALEWLFWSGQVTTRTRRNFERVYDLTERVFPDLYNGAIQDRETAQRELVVTASRALGVATENDLADYFRLKINDARPRIRELAEAGDLVEVKIEGWHQKAYLNVTARTPRSIETAAFFSPFDPLLWERNRTERLFGFRYRIEIYTPAAQRQHGYYVLPFLFGQNFVARLDLKADRANQTLRVVGAFAEPQTEPKAFVHGLAAELRSMADWLGLEKIVISKNGDLAPMLRSALASLGRSA
ncbi:MAG TPA: winged helix-turn-helix domain-containing protein [Chthoniobacterales bacterium]|nr:winged helix-turn-helix domain-containing protein [Chthoniobacterales bacterium]